MYKTWLLGIYLPFHVGRIRHTINLNFGYLYAYITAQSPQTLWYWYPPTLTLQCNKEFTPAELESPRVGFPCCFERKIELSFRAEERSLCFCLPNTWPSEGWTPPELLCPTTRYAWINLSRHVGVAFQVLSCAATLRPHLVMGLIMKIMLHFGCTSNHKSLLKDIHELIKVSYLIRACARLSCPFLESMIRSSPLYYISLFIW